MSELTKLLKLYTTHRTIVEELQIKVALCEESGDWQGGRNNLEILKASMNVLLNEIIPSSDKFYSKIGTADPVTGLNRYGVNTETKISELKSNVELLQFNCEKFLTTLTESVELHCPIVVHIDIPVTNSSITSAFAFDPVKREKDIELETQRLVHEKEEIELAKKAQIVRERKAHEAMEQSQFEEKILAKLLSVERFINTGFARGDRQAVLDAIVSHYKQISSPKSGVELLKMAASIVERVINKPDDSACRRLRITHPMLMSKLTGLVGGIELMVSLGFRLKVSGPSGESSAASSSRPEDQKMTSSHSTAILEVVADSEDSSECISSDTLRVFVLLSPHTVWDGVLEMFEPALDLSASSIGGKNAWIEWFDELTSSRDAINLALKQLQ